MTPPIPAPSEIIAFWRDAGPSRWFARDDAFDAAFSARFMEAHHAAARRELEDWMASAEGALALLILLDQFPRNAFRGSAHAYATDALARHYAARMVEAGLDAQVEPGLRVFCYLPFEHSEAMADQERSVTLVRALGDAGYLRYAEAHRDAIARFGRFPQRNRALGRETTAAELAWLEETGGFG